MPLTSGQIVGYDSERLAFAFTMMNDGETVPCQISDAAMDELAGGKGTPSMARQAQFVAHRPAIEKIASDLYDQAPRFKGYVVRIFTSIFVVGRVVRRGAVWREERWGEA